MIYIKHIDGAINSVIYDAGQCASVNLSNFEAFAGEIPAGFADFTTGKYLFVGGEISLNPKWSENAMNNIWHYPEKQYRVFVPKETALVLAVEMPELSFWIKQKQIKYTNDDGDMYVYFAIIEDVVFAGNAIPFNYVMNIIVTKYAGKFETNENFKP